MTLVNVSNGQPKKKKNHIHACVTLTLNDNRKTEKKLRRYNGDNGKDVDVQLKAQVGNYGYKQENGLGWNFAQIQG